MGYSSFSSDTRGRLAQGWSSHTGAERAAAVVKSVDILREINKKVKKNSFFEEWSPFGQSMEDPGLVLIGIIELFGITLFK